MRAWINVAGIGLNLLGGWILASILILRENEALEYGVPRWAGKREENLRLPMVQLFLKQSRRTTLGMAVVSLGYVLQLIANWPTSHHG